MATLSLTEPIQVPKESGAGPSSRLTLKMDDRGALDGLSRRAAAGAANRFLRQVRRRHVEGTNQAQAVPFCTTQDA